MVKIQDTPLIGVKHYDVINNDTSAFVPVDIKIDTENGRKDVMQLNRTMDDATIKDRTEMISEWFSDEIDNAIINRIEEVQNLLDIYRENHDIDDEYSEELRRLQFLYSDPENGRQAIVKETGITTIALKIRDKVEKYATDPGATQSSRNKFQQVLDNFDLLFDYAMESVAKNEGIRVITDTDLGGIANATVEEEEADESENDDDDEGVRAQNSDGLGIKVRYEDPYKSLSKTVKKLISHLDKVNGRGEKETDDLGYQRYYDTERIYASLMSEMAKVLTGPKDFMTLTPFEELSEKDKKKFPYGKPTFPAIDRLQAKYPWAKQLSKRLVADWRSTAHDVSNPPTYGDLASLMYTNFRKSFIPYAMHKAGKSFLQNVNTGLASITNSTIQNFESGTKLDTEINGKSRSLSIYEGNSHINKSNITKLLGILDEVSRGEFGDLSEILRDAEEIGVDRVLVNNKDLYESAQNTVDNILLGLRSMGLEVDRYFVEHTLQNTPSAMTDIVRNMITVLNKAKNLDKDASLITDKSIKSDWDDLFRSIGGFVTDVDYTTSFRQGKDNKYSYSAPNYLDTIFKKLGGDPAAVTAFIEENFGKYEWFRSKDGTWKNDWIKRIYEGHMAFSMKDLDIIKKGRKDVPYSEWTPDDIREAMVMEFLAGGTGYAYYNCPIFADSPICKLIMGPRYDEVTLKKQFNKLVWQELDRIKYCEERQQLIKDGKALEIQNFDKNGTKFCFTPELNEVLNFDMSGILGNWNAENGSPMYADTLLNVINGIKESTALSTNEKATAINNAIDQALEQVLERKFSEYFSTVNIKKMKALLHSQGYSNTDSDVRSVLHDYFMNSSYAKSEIIQIAATDIAFAKDDTDFQKRWKALYAAGLKLNTQSRLGKEFEKTIYIKDKEVTSQFYNNVRVSLSRAVREHRISKMDMDSILYKLRKVNVSDAQALRSLDSYRAITNMMGKWHDVDDDAYQKLVGEKSIDNAVTNIYNGKWDMSDFNVVWQTIKPVMMTNISVPDGKGGVIRVPHFNKNSEFLLLTTYQLISSSLRNSPQLQAMEKFMKENDIDVIQFESAVKLGGQGIVNLSYSDDRVNKAVADGKFTAGGIEYSIRGAENYNDIKDKLDEALDRQLITQEQYNNAMEYFELNSQEIGNALHIATHNEDGSINEEVVHQLPYEDYCVQQPTPNHLFDSDAVFGSQLRNLAPADMPEDFTMKLPGSDKVLNKKQTLDLYHSLINENLLDGYKEAKGVFSNIHELQKRLKTIIMGNPKYGKDMLEAIQIIKITNPVTGKEEEVFNLPLENISTTEKLQEIVTSIFKNSITKQRINGGSAILASDIGLTHELHINYNEDGSVESFDCYLPATSKAFYETFMKDTIDKDGNHIYELDVEKLHEAGLDKMIGYRIPTEDKYSMVPLRIKGFLPQQNGSAIMLPADITLLSGSDFDVDKMFLMIPQFNVVDGNVKKTEYDFSKPVFENTRKQRNNMLIDLIYGILTNKVTAVSILCSRDFNKVKRTAKILKIICDRFLYSGFVKKYRIYCTDDLRKRINELSLKNLSDFIDKSKVSRSPIYPQTFVYFHTQNFSGKAAIGIYANNITMQAKYQETNLALKDRYTFTINGRNIQSLHEQYIVFPSGERERISKNCANLFAASIDNTKEPILSDVLSTKHTAHDYCFMLRAGMTLDESGLLLAQPVSRWLIETTGTLDGLSEEIDTMIKKGGYKEAAETIRDKGDYRSFDFTTDMLMDNIIRRNHNECKSTSKEEKVNELAALMLLSSIHSMATTLNSLTRISRADTPNGAVDISFAGAEIQRFAVQDFLNQSGNISFPFSGVECVIKNNVVTPDMDVNEIRNKLSNSEMPMLQAFYSLGIDMAVETLGKYFFIGTDFMKDLAYQFYKNAPLKIGKENLQKGLATMYKDAVVFALSRTKMFGDDIDENGHKRTFDQKRQYYLYEYPQKFLDFKEAHPDIASIDAVRRLSVKDGSIVMERSARMGEFQRNKIRRGFANLIYRSPELATNLMMYCYYKDGFNFGPNSYGNLLGTTFLTCFPEFTDVLRNLRLSMDNDDFWTHFMPQYYSNHVSEGLLNRINLTSGSFTETDKMISLNLDVSTFSKFPSNNDLFTYVLFVKGNESTIYMLDERKTTSNYIVYVPVMSLTKNVFNANISLEIKDTIICNSMPIAAKAIVIKIKQHNI